LPAARAEATHQVDIDAPPEEVWPWLVQMGRGRAGWYSWDSLDNGGVASADRIDPVFQRLAVGDVLPIKPSGADGFTVLRLEPARALVLGDPSLLPGRSPARGRPRATWAFSLEPRGAATRLVVRVRVDYAPSLATALLGPIIRFAHAIMERKQLRTLKERVEGSRRGLHSRASADASTSPPLRRRSLRKRIHELVGAGDRMMALTVPFAAAGLAANLLWPGVFRLGLGAPGLVAGVLLVAVGVPIWLTAAVQILMSVPKGKLITSGPFALVLHPIYTSVALLVMPGAGLILDSWLGFGVGAVLYCSQRCFAASEERELAERFPRQYPPYRRRVLLPWL
jgi:protein-S-isoprenylcysteine O-methyltransferase Ste14